MAMLHSLTNEFRLIRPGAFFGQCNSTIQHGCTKYEGSYFCGKDPGGTNQRCVTMDVDITAANYLALGGHTRCLELAESRNASQIWSACNFE